MLLEDMVKFAPPAPLDRGLVSKDSRALLKAQGAYAPIIARQQSVRTNLGIRKKDRYQVAHPTQQLPTAAK